MAAQDIDTPPEDFFSAVATAVEDAPLDIQTPGETGKTPAIQFLSHDDLFSPEPPNESLVVPELGIGAGPPIGIFGQGFAGKTILSMALGMAVALGQPAWGRFPTQQGTWVHFDYEQGKRHTKNRIQRLAAGLGVGAEDLRDRIRVAIYPPVNLTTAQAYEHFVEAMSGATIATVDSLRLATPGVEENSSSIREYMGILSRASEKTGCAVVLIHHAGKTDPKKSRKEMGRGSSGIYDECQSVFVVTTSGDTGNPDRRVTHEKDRELGELVEGFDLRFVDIQAPPDIDETGDVGLDDEQPRALQPLRVEYVDGATAHTTGVTGRIQALVGYLQSLPGGVFEGSRRQLHEAVGGQRALFFEALRSAEQTCQVTVTSRSGQPTLIRAGSPVDEV